MGLLYRTKKKHTLYSKLERRKLLMDILLCSYYRVLLNIWFCDFLSQRKSGVELVKYISKCSIIDVGFFMFDLDLSIYKTYKLIYIKLISL